MKDLFIATSVIVSYYYRLKNAVKLLTWTTPINNIPQVINLMVRGLVAGLLQNAPHNITYWFHVQVGGEPASCWLEIVKVIFAKLLHLCSCMAQSTVLGLHLVGLEPWQNTLLQNFVVGISTYVFSKVGEELRYPFFLSEATTTKIITCAEALFLHIVLTSLMRHHFDNSGILTLDP